LAFHDHSPSIAKGFPREGGKIFRSGDERGGHQRWGRARDLSIDCGNGGFREADPSRAFSVRDRSGVGRERRGASNEFFDENKVRVTEGAGLPIVAAESVNVSRERLEVLVRTKGGGTIEIIIKISVLILLTNGLFFRRPRIPEGGDVLELILRVGGRCQLPAQLPEEACEEFPKDFMVRVGEGGTPSWSLEDVCEVKIETFEAVLFLCLSIAS
jgi:hypothetical protein